MNKPADLSAPYSATAGTLSAAQLTVSTMSWGAILAGATAAAALSMILLLLGVGLGLSTVSPWVSGGIGATALQTSTILWLTFTQLLVSGLGGYLAGRLRNSWVDVHTDEVYFRDTAHGFLAWAIASLVTASLLTSAVGAVLGNGSKAATPRGMERASSVQGVEVLPYFVDTLLRQDPKASPVDGMADSQDGLASPELLPSSGMRSSEVSRIVMTALRSGSLASEDRLYLAYIVALHTGLNPKEAETRVSSTFARLQASLDATETAALDGADRARRVAINAALWLFVSLLIGAFSASLAATYGGRQRDY